MPLPRALPPEFQIKISPLSGAAFDQAYLNEQTAGRDADLVALAAPLQPITEYLRDALALGGTAPQSAPAPASLGAHAYQTSCKSGGLGEQKAEGNKQVPWPSTFRDFRRKSPGSNGRTS